MKNGHLSVRVPSALKAALEKLADAEKRTLASYVHFVLHQHVESVTRKDGKSRKS
jgi:hypothetical protein